jgi:DNA-binding MarR family transcriptional regulator
MSDADPMVAALEEWIDVFMNRSMQNLIQFARKNELSMSQIGALFHLEKMGTSGVTDLGEHLGVTSAAASQMLERLVQQGLIQRSEDPHDRRVKQINLTEAGCLILEGSIRWRKGWLEGISNTLSEGETESIISALNLLIDRAQYLDQTSKPESLL